MFCVYALESKRTCLHVSVGGWWLGGLVDKPFSSCTLLVNCDMVDSLLSFYSAKSNTHA